MFVTDVIDDIERACLAHTKGPDSFISTYKNPPMGNPGSATGCATDILFIYWKAFLCWIALYLCIHITHIYMYITCIPVGNWIESENFQYMYFSMMF